MLWDITGEQPKEGITLPELLKAWKGASSRAVGRVVGRRMTDEAFWQKDYFDRIVRDAEQTFGHIAKAAIHWAGAVGVIRAEDAFDATRRKLSSKEQA